ncbi:MAG: metal-dependent transcriptional regulator [Succinivibrio sp.]|nr:metal-dependent transcriptional regulator [Succinivibrio sp.]
MEQPQYPSAMDAVPATPQQKVGEIAESGETYLETILVMKERNNGQLVRSVDIANELNFSKPSVSRGLGLLRDKDLIKIGSNGGIEFTPQGLQRAQHIFKRHQLLTLLLQEVAKVPSDVAERDACRIEHVISDQTMDGILKYLSDRKLV